MKHWWDNSRLRILTCLSVRRLLESLESTSMLTSSRLATTLLIQMFHESQLKRKQNQPCSLSTQSSRNETQRNSKNTSSISRAFKIRIRNHIIGICRVSCHKRIPARRGLSWSNSIICSRVSLKPLVKDSGDRWAIWTDLTGPPLRIGWGATVATLISKTDQQSSTLAHLNSVKIDPRLHNVSYKSGNSTRQISQNCSDKKLKSCNKNRFTLSIRQMLLRKITSKYKRALIPIKKYLLEKMENRSR